MTFSQYPQLKQQIMISVSAMNKPNKILYDLKEQYKDKINSPRRNEQIQTIGQLLLVLEIRDILSENNVTPLKEIAQCLGNHDLSSKIDVFERMHVPTEEHNNYGLNNKQVRKLSHEQKKVNYLASKTSHTNVCQQKKERIHEIIVKELGIYWRDLARNLKVTECLIDEIDKQNETLYSKAKRLLEIYEQKADPQQWVFILCESLERARRKDLAKAIQEILTKETDFFTERACLHQ